jgi:hypothetical protein
MLSGVLDGAAARSHSPSTRTAWRYYPLVPLRRTLVAGTLPESLGSLLQLSALELYDNNIGGTIPGGYGFCNKLKYCAPCELSENPYTYDCECVEAESRAWVWVRTYSQTIKLTQPVHGVPSLRYFSRTLSLIPYCDGYVEGRCGVRCDVSPTINTISLVLTCMATVAAVALPLIWRRRRCRQNKRWALTATTLVKSGNPVVTNRDDGHQHHSEGHEHRAGSQISRRYDKQVCSGTAVSVSRLHCTCLSNPCFCCLCATPGYATCRPKRRHPAQLTTAMPTAHPSRI